MQSPAAYERFNVCGYPELADGKNTAFLRGGAKPYVKSNELKRGGVMAVVEWEPSDKFHTTIDAYWSRFKDDQRLRGIELPLARSEEHTSELQLLMRIPYAVFFLKKKINNGLVL